jgi:hypothetical protein
MILFPKTASWFPIHDPVSQNSLTEFALQDGGKAAVEDRNNWRKEAIMMYRVLGHYVEIACKNDMNTNRCLKGFEQRD